MESSSSDTAKTIYVHVTFLKFGEVDTLKEKYQADVLLTCRWREDSLRHVAMTNPRLLGQLDWDQVWNPKVNIYNVVETPAPKITIFKEAMADKQGYVWIIERTRVKGTFWEPLELQDFPFDVQDLSVTIISEFSKHEVLLLDDPTAIHVVNRADFIDSQEWSLYDYSETETKEMCRDPLYPSLKVEALIVKAKAARKPNYYLFNHFLIICLLSSLSFTVFAVPEKIIPSRLQISFTLLLTTVAYKFVCNQSLPKLSYLTYLDQYVLWCIGVLVVLPMWHAILSVTWVHKFKHKDVVMISVYTFLYFTLNIMFWIMIYTGPFRKRRKYQELEKFHLMQREENIKERKKRLKGTNPMKNKNVLGFK